MYSFSHEFYILASFLFSMVICYALIPSVLELAREKKLYDEPNHRSSHTTIIPSLGGVAIFIGFALAILTFSNGFLLHELKYIIASAFIVFFLGIKDDIMIISARRKLIGQIAAAFIIIVLGDIRISNFHGVFGINELNYFVSIVFTVFLIVVITNGFNLIDGIDGLASGISALCTFSLGLWFYMTGHYEYVILAGSLLGALLAFFRFNVFGKHNKIFMGDTGSLIIGLLISILVIHFNELNIIPEYQFAIKSAPAVSVGILIIPLFDTLRVMIIRIKNKKSPFQPDRNHIHHCLLDLGFKHIQATLIIMLANSLFVVLVFSLQDYGNSSLLLIIVGLGVLLSWVPSFLLQRRRIRTMQVI